MHPLLASFTLLLSTIGQQPADVLTAARRAITVTPEAKQWQATALHGTATYYGEPGSYTLVFAPDGRFMQSVKSDLGESFGCDGTRYWQVDRSGAPRELNFEDRDMQQAILMMLTGAWANPPEGVAVSSQASGFTIKLRSGMEEKVAVDPSSSLPSVATFETSAGTITVKMGDWREAGAIKVPFKAEISEGGLTDTFTVTDATWTDPPSFAMPQWTPSKILFDNLKPPSVESKKAISGHILVHPLVNGKDVGWFILDSGADIMVIDPKVADDLKLKSVGKLPLVGIGGVVQEPFRIVDTFQMGPATISNIAFAELDLAQIGQYLGVKMAGIVGYDYFRRTIVGVDLETASVEVYNPLQFQLSSGSWTPMKFSSGNPVVEAKLEGNRSGWFRLDTGANGTVAFHSPFVVKEQLLKDRKTSASGNMGVGGVSEARTGLIEWFELAGHRFENPSATFSLAKQGAFTDTYLAGNIGQDFMKPFKVLFDFGGSRVALVPKESK